MKKLITILGAISLTVSSGSLAVACGSSNTQKWTTPVLDQELFDKVLASIKGDESLSSITNGDIFNNIDFKKTIKDMLDDAVTKLAYKNYQEIQNSKLGFNNLNKEDYYKTVEKMASEVAQNRFYSEYTSSLQQEKSTSKDEEIAMAADGSSLYILNPSELLTVENTTDVDKLDTNDYYVWFLRGDQWLRWQYQYEYKYSNSNTTKLNQIPTISELENSEFIIIKETNTTNDKNSLPKTDVPESPDETKLFYIDSEKGAVGLKEDSRMFYSLDGQNILKMSGKEALEYRFQSYFKSKIKTEIINNVLSMVFLDNNLWRIGLGSSNENKPSRNDLYFNNSSDVATTVQTWNRSTGYTSKLKLVWSFTVDQEKAREVSAEIANDINPDGSIKESLTTSIKSLYEKLNTKNGKNQSTAGVDPFFGMAGFNGFVKNSDNSVVSVDGNLIVDQEANPAIANVNTPSILTNNGYGYNSQLTNQKDFVLVIPLYMIDLFNDKEQTYNNGDSSFVFKKNDKTTNLFKDSLGINEYGADKTSIMENYITNVNQQNWKFVYNNQTLTLEQMKSLFPSDFSGTTQKTIFEDVVTDGKFEDITGLTGIVSSIPNTFKTDSSTVFGNINYQIGSETTINSDVDLTNQFNDQNINVSAGTDNQYKIEVKGPNNLKNTIIKSNDGKIILSFDDAGQNNLLTVDGTNKNNGKTLGYKVNMGPSQNNSNSYVNDGMGFDYYSKNIASRDIIELNKTGKQSLLRQVEYITSKEADVSTKAASEIYPQFITENDVLYKDLYDEISAYIKDTTENVTD